MPYSEPVQSPLALGQVDTEYSLVQHAMTFFSGVYTQQRTQMQNSEQHLDLARRFMSAAGIGSIAEEQERVEQRQAVLAHKEELKDRIDRITPSHLYSEEREQLLTELYKTDIDDYPDRSLALLAAQHFSNMNVDLKQKYNNAIGGGPRRNKPHTEAKFVATRKKVTVVKGGRTVARVVWRNTKTNELRLKTVGSDG